MTKKLKILVSLSTKDNDYQVEQAISAELTARRLGVDVQIIYAENDAINQSQQLLGIVQSPKESHPDAVVFESVGGTAFPLIAREAVAAGIGWVILNREADYLGDLRRTTRCPVFSISSDHMEIGRIQAQQVALLAPQGGNVIYIQGPSNNSAAQQRLLGMQQGKPANINLTILRGKWTEESALKSVAAWASLSTSPKLPIELVCSQNDSMALGAREAFEQMPDKTVGKKWLGVPFLGVDGLPKTGQAYVQSGLLAATVIVPPNTGRAIGMVVEAIQKGQQPPPMVMTVPLSFPPLESLAARRRTKSPGAS